ncbi:sensor histidine kinase [Nonomuraea gerenzanensis]|uniref:histidine kinase n=1 Tax=Nonomuraea gerenzanensis TaxID=93944 RepID=A0A1M4EF85_9ACTN|nr:sensor histidine kinase [Nonomuraea gerenzanensis]UBU09050.1 histidine kinase [Nonomuraea gerenzanensis]SBO97434.1 two-component system sensor kinase [Nonomuraea gerenzanensis]
MHDLRDQPLHPSPAGHPPPTNQAPPPRPSSESPDTLGSVLLYLFASIPLLITLLLLVTLSSRTGEAVSSLPIKLLDVASGVAGLVLLRWRRRWPWQVALLTAVPSAVFWCLNGPAIVAFASLAAHRRWRQVVPVAVVFWLSFVGSSLWVQGPWLLTALYALVGGVTLTGLTVFGLYLRGRRELTEAQRAAAEWAQAQRVEQAKLEERLRIAHEMHDVLAHRISLLSMLAGGLAYRKDLTGEEAREAALAIQENAHQSLNELRGVLGTLRRDSVGNGTLRHDSIKDGSLRRDSVKDGTLRRDSVKDGTLRRDSVKDGTLRRDKSRDGARQPDDADGHGVLQRGSRGDGTLQSGDGENGGSGGDGVLGHDDARGSMLGRGGGGEDTLRHGAGGDRILRRGNGGDRALQRGNGGDRTHRRGGGGGRVLRRRGGGGSRTLQHGDEGDRTLRRGNGEEGTLHHDDTEADLLRRGDDVDDTPRHRTQAAGLVGGVEAPQPSLNDLNALFTEVRTAGQHVEVHDTITTRELLPAQTGRHAYRIVQEALTNARKHAPGTPVRAEISGRPGAGLRIRVSNAVPVGAPAGPGGRLGLIGLAERTRMAGGTIAHGVRDGRFVLEASLPWEA